MATRLWSLLLLLTTLLWSVTASAFSPSSAETRVGAFEFAAATLVGLPDTVSLGTHRENWHGYDRIASGETHAARGLFSTVDEILANPNLLRGLKPTDVLKQLGGKAPSGWRIETLGKGAHKGQGWVLRQ